jgi:hypothetical protein
LALPEKDSSAESFLQKWQALSSFSLPALIHP